MVESPPVEAALAVDTEATVEEVSPKPVAETENPCREERPNAASKHE